MEAMIESVRDTISFKPDFREFVERLNKSQKLAFTNWATTLFSLQQRVQKNGSFALVVNERLDFYFESTEYQLFNISFVKRMNHPEICNDNKIFPQIGSKCEKASAPKLDIDVEKNKIGIQFPSIGLYTLIIHIRDKRNQEYYQTIVAPNYLIVEELIKLACFTIDTKESITVHGYIEGLSINLGAVYEWQFILDKKKEISTSRYYI